MAWIVQSLNEEWATVASSPAARRALMRWTSRNPALATKSTRFGSFFLGFLASCALFLSPLAGKIVLAWQMLWKSLMLAVS